MSRLRRSNWCSAWLIAAALWMGAEGGALAAGFDQSCLVSFNMDQFSLVAVGQLDFVVDYPAGRVSFTAASGAVSCQSLIAVEHSAVFSADDSVGRLSVSLGSSVGFVTFTPLARCDLWASGLAVSEDFAITVTSELDTSGAPVAPQVPVGLLAVDCMPLVTTTTTVVSTTTTTTTTVPPAWCSRPLSRGGSSDAPVASDCLFILRAAVGLEQCSPACICRPTGNLAASGPTASDALVCLTLSVGSPASLNCPC